MTDHENDVCQCDECKDARLEQELFDMGVDVDELADQLPPEREYLVTATIQLVISESNPTFAFIDMKERLQKMIDESSFRLDPMNGAVIDRISDITTTDDL